MNSHNFNDGYGILDKQCIFIPVYLPNINKLNQIYFLIQYRIHKIYHSFSFLDKQFHTYSIK